jgi:hypothetical protein
MKCEPSLKDFKRAAEYVASSFTVGERRDVYGESIIVLKNGSSDVREAVREAHPASMLPTDMVYRWCSEAADIIADADDLGDADRALDEWYCEWPIYTRDGRLWAATCAAFDYWREEVEEERDARDLDEIIAAVAAHGRESCAASMRSLVVEITRKFDDEADAEREEEADHA